MRKPFNSSPVLSRCIPETLKVVKLKAFPESVWKSFWRSFEAASCLTQQTELAFSTLCHTVLYRDDVCHTLTSDSVELTKSTQSMTLYYHPSLLNRWDVGQQFRQGYWIVRDSVCTSSLPMLHSHSTQQWLYMYIYTVISNSLFMLGEWVASDRTVLCDFRQMFNACKFY